MGRLGTRREFLAGAGSVTLAGLAGCTSTTFTGWDSGPDRTLYAGAYHWGFILLDEDGTERERVELEEGSNVRIVAFGAGADEAIATLPDAAQESLPGHEALEARNEELIPAPNEEYLHEALENAEERYPDHSLAIIPAEMDRMQGGMMGGGMMEGGMMGNRGMPLPHDATEPTVTTLTADQRGYFTLHCGVYCGYGHQYMDKDGAIVVR